MGRARIFVLIYLISGMAALVYEVIWLRVLTLTMGHTVGAVGTVLAAFMSGLAIGAAVAARRASTFSPQTALRTYAALELTIAVCALLVPFAVRVSGPLLAWAYADGTGGTTFELMRVALSLLILVIPSAAMGASYPLGVASLPGFGIGDWGFAKNPAGLLYAVNTLGAALGAGLTGFLLLPRLGLFGTTLAGVSLNVLCAIGALALSRRTFAPSDAPAISRTLAPSHPRSNRRTLAPSDAPPHPRTFAPSSPAPSSPAPSSPAPSHLVWPAATLAVSGLVALVYEVVWTRILAMILGPTTYAFSAMLVAFIAGLGIGSAIAAAFASRIRQPGVWLGMTMMVAAGAALVACARVDSLPLAIAVAAGRSDTSFNAVFALEVGLVIAMQLPMTIALGAAFPFALAQASVPGGSLSTQAGTIYAANTVGAIAGALLGSFLLIGRLGLQTSLQVVSAIAIVAGLVAAWRAGARSARAVAAVVATAALATVFLLPRWNQERLANGAYRFAPSLAAGDVQTGLEAGHLSYYREGAAATVSVKELLGVTSLAIDGKVDASNGSDMLTQKLLGHLPLLLHENPKRVLVIGLGSGVTLGATLAHPIEQAEVAEISPEVVEASEAFAKENHNALRDPRTRLIVGDGRSHLLLTDQSYDVIISEPSNPWMAGVSALFTREFFASARTRLAPGGILCQWAHTYTISSDDLRSIVATFLSVFPEGSAWLVGEADLLLIGSPTPLQSLLTGIDGSAGSEGSVQPSWRRPGVATDLAEVGVADPFGVLSLFVASGADLRRYAEGAVIQSDDGLALEFSAPRAIYGRFERENVDALRAIAMGATRPPAIATAYSGATAAQWRNRAQMRLRADAATLAVDDFLESLEQAPDDLDSLDGLGRAAAASGRLNDVLQYLEARESTGGSPGVFIELSAVLAALGRADEAAIAAQRAAVLAPANTRALEQLIATLADSGNEAALEQLCGLLNQGGDASLSARCGMRLSFMRGDFAATARHAEQLATGPRNADAARTLNLAGSAYASLGDHARARRAFLAALTIAPRDAAVLVNLGLTELNAGQTEAAAERFSEALFLYPTLAPALDGLAQAYDRMGEPARASALRALRGSS